MRRDKIEGLWKHILLGYWIAAAFLFYFYAILMTIRMNGVIHEAFFHNPYIALGSLFPFLMLFQASILYFLEKRTIDISLLSNIPTIYCCPTSYNRKFNRSSFSFSLCKKFKKMWEEVHYIQQSTSFI